LPKTPSAFTASSSAAGYYYQARLALLESLRYVYGDSGVEVAIERFDDVSFEKNAKPLELLQTKHHIGKLGDLTDTSADLWKTLRIWIEATKNDPALPSRTRLLLITTAQAPADSAASFLRPDDDRDVPRAEELLIKAAGKSKNQSLEEAFKAFQALAPQMRSSLLGVVEVLDRAPTLIALQTSIEERLKLIAPRGKVVDARELLEGWWWPRICHALEAGGAVIPILEIEAKLDDIRETMRRDALPLDMEHAEPPEDALAALDEMTFVRQLQQVGVGGNRVQYAKRDYYRAFTQRSKWTRQSLVFDGEVAKYERTLVEEWQPRFSVMCDKLDGSTTAAAVRQAGQELYHWVEAEARFPFRSISSRFLSVGSYHILANDLRLGWHRDYGTLCDPSQESSDGE
jgi:hypothetical protein